MHAHVNSGPAPLANWIAPRCSKSFASALLAFVLLWLVAHRWFAVNMLAKTVGLLRHNVVMLKFCSLALIVLHCGLTNAAFDDDVVLECAILLQMVALRKHLSLPRAMCLLVAGASLWNGAHARSSVSLTLPDDGAGSQPRTRRLLAPCGANLGVDGCPEPLNRLSGALGL